MKSTIINLIIQRLRTTDMLLHNGIANIIRSKSVPFKVVAVAVAGAIRQNVVVQKAFSSSSARTPAGLFAKTCLCATLLPFPVVEAWSVWNKEGTLDDPDMAKFAKTLRFKNDASMTSQEKKALIQDMYHADYLHKNGEISDQKEIYALLDKHRNKKEPELQWRLARITYDLSKKAGTSEEKAKMLDEAFQLVTTALEIDDSNFAVHKWVAILLNEVSVMKGLKEQIIQSFNVKKHMMRAMELNPTDPTCHYMIGHWCFTVAEVSWVERKFAATIFASPPESSYKEALDHFLNAEKIRPGFYSKNHLMLAKTYIRLGEVDKSAKYLKALEGLRVRTDDDLIAKTEGLSLIAKYFKDRKVFNDAIRVNGEMLA